MTTFRLLAPLGLLALLSVAALIIIYIIKPNYQQKVISTTYVWKLSLKYRKKRIPTSKLRNIILIICQILILTISSIIITWPSLVTRELSEYDAEAVVILDASASMRTVNSDDVTRFERAIDEIKSVAELVEQKNGAISVIFADDDPEYLFERYSYEDMDKVYSGLDALKDDGGDLACTYGGADIDKALEMTERVLTLNPDAEVYVFTDKSYTFVPEGVKLMSVNENTEFNVSILNAYAEEADNQYGFYVDVACYGALEMAGQIDVFIQIQNPNANEYQPYTAPVTFSAKVNFDSSETISVIFKNDPETSRAGNRIYVPISAADKIYNFETANVYLTADDSFAYDNNFVIYGGVKEQIKIQYYSGLLENDIPSGPNPFMQAALMKIRSYFSSSFDIRLDEIKEGENDYAVSGYDFYVFEHVMPSIMPSDGVVILFDPATQVPTDAGFRISSVAQSGKVEKNLVSQVDAKEDPVLKYIDVEDIFVTRYTRVVGAADYDILATVEGNPAIMVKKDESEQVAVVTFSVHYSNIGLLRGSLVNLMVNLFEYYIPATVDGYSFEVGESVTVNARSDRLDIKGYNTSIPTIREFPSKVVLDTPGTYELTQTTYFDKPVTERVFVKVPSSECMIWQTEDGLASPYRLVYKEDIIDDLLLYFAIAVVALLFLEWFLQMRENS